MSSLPTTLGQYQIIREIARSNDIVYEAYDPLMNRRVAIKELAAPNGLSPQQKEERVSRFKREAQAAGSLNHPNIMTVYSFAEDAGRHFMAMEYLDGHTLRNEIDTKGFLTIDRAVEIAVAVLQGLGHAHAKGVIHRDIKPDNIQILSDGEIKITDFGIARLTFQPNLTMDGQVFGTPSYMSPEQVVGKEIDQRSDLFSVGILLYEMLSGQKPFVGDNVVAISHAIMNKEPSQPPTITIELWRVISKAIQKTPMLRYQSSDEFIADLRSAINVRDAVDPGTYGSPYGGGAPVPHAAPAPAPGYAFNPYVSPQPAVVPPPVVQPQTSFPVPQSNPYYTQAPIYYPPPPRQPLLKPEQSLFVKRLLMTVMLVGTLFLVVVVGVSELSKAVQRWNAERTDAELVQKLRDPASNLPLGEKIRRYEDLRDKLQSEESRRSANRDIAVLYEQAGKVALQKGNLIGAESYFKEAVRLDPENSAYYTDLGDLYTGSVNRTFNVIQRSELLHSGAKAWANAARYELDATRREQYGRTAVQAALLFAAGVQTEEQREQARELLVAVRPYAPMNGAEIQQVDQMLDRLRGWN